MALRALYPLLLSLIIWQSASPTYGHTNLADPRPTRKSTCRMGGEEFNLNCPGPCPKVWEKNPETSADKPAASWKRGQKTMIKWHKNNHDGGFVRLTLVPLDMMMSKQAHSDYAFWYGCYDEGKHQCQNRNDEWECGSDGDGLAFQTEVTVPENLADGKYMLGMTWYGGAKWTGTESYFGDYWACSHITIEGGASLKGSWKPFWNGKKCLASVNRMGECKREPCNGKGARMMVPAKFENKAAPSKDDGGHGDGGDNGAIVDDKGAKEKPQQETEADHSKDLVVKGLMLYQADTNKKLNHDFSKPIDTKMYKEGFTIAADVKGTTSNVEKVEFFVDGKFANAEFAAPYTISGDIDGDMAGWDYPKKEKMEVKVRVVLASGDFYDKTYMVYLKL